MNPESHSKDLSPAQDRLTDALLAEHARLGKDTDEDLISKILLRTVHAPVESAHFSPAPPPRLGFGEWSKIAAVVIGILSLGVLVLNRFGSGGTVARIPERQEERFHLVVSYVDSERGEKPATRLDRKILVSAPPGSNRFVPVAAGAPDPLAPFAISEAELAPPLTAFEKSIDEWPEVSSSAFKLASNDTMSAGEKIIYSGDVVLSHAKFILKADSLVIDKSGAVEGVPVLKALNATLTHRRGVYETEADAISFDPFTGELVARGVLHLFRQGVEQPLLNRGATVVFGDDEYFIDASLARPY